MKGCVVVHSVDHNVPNFCIVKEFLVTPLEKFYSFMKPFKPFVIKVTIMLIMFLLQIVL